MLMHELIKRTGRKLSHRNCLETPTNLIPCGLYAAVGIWLKRPERSRAEEGGKNIKCIFI